MDQAAIATILEAAGADAISAAGLPVEGARLVGIGWATVELDRAAVEISVALGLTVDPFIPAQGSRALGASCRVADALLPGGTTVVLLEPDTEGRLAATLARHGEGAVAAWYASAVAVGPAAWAPTDGPFGPERLVAGGSVFGPHRFLIDPRPGTIRT